MRRRAFEYRAEYAFEPAFHAYKVWEPLVAVLEGARVLLTPREVPGFVRAYLGTEHVGREARIVRRRRGESWSVFRQYTRTATGVREERSRRGDAAIVRLCEPFETTFTLITEPVGCDAAP